MFRTITRLLFGGEEEAAKAAESDEVVDDGWLVVTHQEAASLDNQDALFADTKQSNSTPPRNTTANTESDNLLDAEPTVLRGSTTTSRVGSFLQPKALTEVTQLTCIQKAKAWAGRHQVSRKTIQRQNRVCRDQQHSFHLQQPGHRSLSR